MKINLVALGMEMTPAIRAYAEKKLEAVEKKMGDGADEALATLELKKTTQHHQNGFVFRVELRLSWNKEQIVVAPEAEDLYAAIDIMKDEAIREVTTRHDRAIVRARKGAREIKKLLHTETE